jgi:hypothetical protein
LTLHANEHGQYTHDAILLIQKGIQRVLVSQFNPSDPGKGMVKILDDGDNILMQVQSTDAITAKSVLKSAKKQVDALSTSIVAGLHCTCVSFPHPCGSSEYGVTVDIHHNHDVLVASLQARRELACLIGEHGFAYPVCYGVDVWNFLAVELGGVTRFQRCCFGFDGAHIFSCLILMTFYCFNCLGVVLLDIAFI